ncbi:hypothetical protein [Roseateles sp. P5_D6]
MTIEASESESGIFQVESASTRLEELAALYLFLCSGSAIASSQGPLGDAQRAELQAGYGTELQRAAKAVWHQSSDSNPYPNLPALQRPNGAV